MDPGYLIIGGFWVAGAIGVLFAARRRVGAAALALVPKEPPYRTLASPDASEELRVCEQMTRAIERERDKYLHALEAIATCNQDRTSQRIALQALGRKWT